MFVATHIAKPGALTSAVVEALRSTWGGAPNVWLSGGEAGEFEIPSIPSNRWDDWDGLQG